MSIQAKKTLGQHFLRSDKAVREIVEAGEVSKKDTVLEIGPGEGVLTEALLNTGATIVVVEMDERCIPILHTKFEKEEKHITSNSVVSICFFRWSILSKNKILH